MLIRAATADDVPAVLPMVRAVCEMHRSLDPARFDYLDDVVERYERWLPMRAADPRSVFLVAQDPARERELAGFLIGSVETNIPIYRTTEFGFVHDVWVDPQHRRKGLARALGVEALRRFARIGVTQIRLEVAAGNDSARRLFSSIGFRTGAVEMVREVSP